MKRLGEILLERGLIDVSELHTGLEACHHKGGRLGSHLLNFGFVDEHALLQALSTQLDVPSVPMKVLCRAPEALRRLLPLQIARRLRVVAFDRDGENLSVAMMTPRSPATLAEIVSHVGQVIKPHVATEIAILTALAELKEEYAARIQVEIDTDFGAAIHGENGAERDADLEQWQNLWSPPALQSSDLLRPLRDRSSEEFPPTATFPGLSPVPAGGVTTAEDLDDEIFSELLGTAERRDDVGQLLLRRASAVMERCYLLAVHSGQTVGWQARGSGVVVDDVESLVVSADAPSVLLKLKGPTVFYGRVEAGPVNDELLSALGEPEPGEIAILPVMVKNRVVAYLVGDVPGSTIPEEGLDQLTGAVQKAGVAFEILILKKKFLG